MEDTTKINFEHKQKKNFVSIVIPAYKRKDLLEKTLKSVQKQSIDQKKYEVIVVNDGGDEAVKKLCEKYPVVYVDIVLNTGGYFARNKGIEKAKGEYIGFIDSDIIVPENWLETALENIKKYDYIGGPIKIKKKKNPTWIELYQYKTAYKNKDYLKQFNFLLTGNLFVKREVIKKVGGFDSRLKSSGDHEFGNRVHENGNFEQKFVPELTVTHPYTDFKTILEKQKRIAQGMIKLYSLYPERFKFLKVNSIKELIKMFIPKNRFQQFPLFLIDYFLQIRMAIVKVIYSLFQLENDTTVDTVQDKPKVDKEYDKDVKIESSQSRQFTKKNWPSWQTVIVLTAMILLGIFLRGVNLVERPLSAEESLILTVAKEGFPTLITENAVLNDSPPLFSMLISLITNFTDSVLWLRLPSLIAGLASIWGIFRLAKKFMPENIAYIPALMMTISPTAVILSQQATEQSLTIFLAILIYNFFIKYYYKPNFINWIVITMLTSLGLGLHYGVGVIIVALNIIMLIGIIRKQVLWKGATGWVLLQFELNLIFYLIFSNGLKFQILTGNFPNILTAPTVQTILGNSFQIINMAYPLGVAGIFIVYASAVKALRSYYGQLALMMAGFPVLISIVFNLLGLYPYNLQDNSKYNITLTVMIYVLAGMTFHLLYKNISSVKMFFLFVLLFVMVVMMGLYGVFLTIL